MQWILNCRIELDVIISALIVMKVAFSMFFFFRSLEGARVNAKPQQTFIRTKVRLKRLPRFCLAMPEIPQMGVWSQLPLKGSPPILPLQPDDPILKPQPFPTLSLPLHPTPLVFLAMLQEGARLVWGEGSQGAVG